MSTGGSAQHGITVPMEQGFPKGEIEPIIAVQANMLNFFHFQLKPLADDA